MVPVTVASRTQRWMAVSGSGMVVVMPMEVSESPNDIAKLSHVFRRSKLSTSAGSALRRFVSLG